MTLEVSLASTLYIVDGSFHFRAAFFALPSMRSPDGTPINAVYGFLSMLLKLIRDRRPHRLVIAEDVGRAYFRHTLYPEYKASKVRVPEECNIQVPILKRILSAMNIPCVGYEGFEADDVVATIVRAAQKCDCTSYVCSRDKDLCQLLADNVLILDTTSGQEISPLVFWERYGIHPHQIPDYLALTGDSADNIPGIPGVGKKTAVSLLARFNTLDAVLEHADTIGGKIGSSIKCYHEQALLARELASLRSDVPIPVALEDYVLELPKADNIAQLFCEIGLQSLVKRLATCQITEKKQGLLFGDG